MIFLSVCEFIEKSYMLHEESYIYFTFFQLFWLVQSSRCHPDADSGFSAMLCVLSTVSLFSDGMLYSAAFSFYRVDLVVLRSPF